MQVKEMTLKPRKVGSKSYFTLIPLKNDDFYINV